MAVVSVIMPVYNTESFLKQSISSILDQTFLDFEFLIIDDASTDSSLEIIEEFTDNRIKLFRNVHNLGSLKSRNKLFKEVNGTYIIFQDSDDYSELDRIEKLVCYMDKNVEVYLCGSNVKYYNEKHENIFNSNKPTSYVQIKEEMKSNIAIICASAIVRTEVLSSIGGYREYFDKMGYYDYDWMSRISDKYPCANLKEFLYNVNRRKESNSSIILNPYKLIADQTVQFLAKERELKGIDSLTTDVTIVHDFARKKLQPYKDDTSLYLNKIIIGMLAENMFPDAFRCSLKAILRNPLKLRNYRTSFYVLRKWMGKSRN
tara:strand:+ start:47 stop:997 length:951 start_codon:yes stop_codon:yes gene_type:complete